LSIPIFALPLGQQQLVVAFRQLIASHHLGIVREHSRVHVKRRPVAVGVFVLFRESALLGGDIFLQMTGFGVVDHRQVAAAENVGAKKLLLVLRDRNVQQPLATAAQYIDLDERIFFSEGFL
jgi:hypothetical protein